MKQNVSAKGCIFERGNRISCLGANRINLFVDYRLQLKTSLVRGNPRTMLAIRCSCTQPPIINNWRCSILNVSLCFCLFIQKKIGQIVQKFCGRLTARLCKCLWRTWGHNFFNKTDCMEFFCPKFPQVFCTIWTTSLLQTSFLAEIFGELPLFLFVYWAGDWVGWARPCLPGVGTPASCHATRK